MPRRNDLSGKTFGRLYVIEPSDKRTSSGSIKWKCSCSCGSILFVRSDSLVSGHTTSCGCFNREQSTKTHLVDLTGQVFSRLTVLHKDPASLPKQPRWICQCACGATVSILGHSLRTENTKSCGCLQEETARALTEARNLVYRQRFDLNEPSKVQQLRVKHKKLRPQILLRDNYKCVLCQSVSNLEIHHIIPLSVKLIDSPSNLVSLCTGCHRGLAHRKLTAEVVPEIQRLLLEYIRTFW